MNQALTAVVSTTSDEQAIQFLGLVEKPRQDPIAAALELIEEQSRKVSYDSKTKWLRLTGDPKLLKAVASKMQADCRRRYGTSGRDRLNMRLQLEEDGWILYIHTNR